MLSSFHVVELSSWAYSSPETETSCHVITSAQTSPHTGSHHSPFYSLLFAILYVTHHKTLVFCVCIVYMCAYKLYILICACLESRGQCQVSFSIAVDFSFWDRVSQWSQNLMDQLDSPPSKSPGLTCLCVPSVGVTDVRSHAVSKDLNSGPHACSIGPLLTESSPQPQRLSFYDWLTRFSITAPRSSHIASGRIQSF